MRIARKTKKIPRVSVDPNSVRNSRAGDVFHYRWAARRCLRLIDPRSCVKVITVEASREREAPGELVIDLAEYGDGVKGEKASYFQLKHTTVQKHKSFALSDLKNTLQEFAKRFIASTNKRNKSELQFWLITNRPISKKLKLAVLQESQVETSETAMRKKLEEATQIKGIKLQEFLKLLNLIDEEGDYIAQKRKLHEEMEYFIAGFVDNKEVDNLIALVEDRALPQKKSRRNIGEIVAEDVLERLGFTSEKGLFPAPPKLEDSKGFFLRNIHNDIINQLIKNEGVTLIHAEGGVGKSVLAQQVAKELPKGSIGVIYDCFGGGGYRNASEPRHRACDALVQIANELTVMGLCDPLVATSLTPSESIFEKFTQRIKQAIKTLREANPSAVLIILVDAADNAEMAAEERGEKCFARDMLRMTLPLGCRLVGICRTERIYLLQPLSTVRMIQLPAFDVEESSQHLRIHFPESSNFDGVEFHRLTGGNPRVQASSMALRPDTVVKLLANLGPTVMTVDDQINAQLRLAINTLRDKSTHTQNSQIESICTGLANLPPFIPLEVLAAVSLCDISSIKSFISDLGRPLWLSDNSVQFRDEPTETWFRNRFAADAKQIGLFADSVEPLAYKLSYVAKALPELLLRSQNYERLISLALSDDCLPGENVAEEQSIRVYRLQFAFKATLKLGRMADAAKLAFRAGEEVAGSDRQWRILIANIDLVANLFDSYRIQELAFKQTFRGLWDGSENLYSGALLSAVGDFSGEARSYIRAANHWLQIYFEKCRKEQDKWKIQDELNKSEIAELIWANYNLFGCDKAVKSLLCWSPPIVIFEAGGLFVRKLLDAAHFEKMDDLAKAGANNVYFILALVEELSSVGKFTDSKYLTSVLDILSDPEKRPQAPESYGSKDAFIQAVVSFTEACIVEKMSIAKVKAVLDHYVTKDANSALREDYYRTQREIYLRKIALQSVLFPQNTIIPEELLAPVKSADGPASYEESDRRKGALQVIRAFLPLYVLRLKCLLKNDTTEITIKEEIDKSKTFLRERYQTYDPLRCEVTHLWARILQAKTTASYEEITQYLNYVSSDSKHFALHNLLEDLRAVFRMPHLEQMRAPLEKICRLEVKNTNDGSPEDKASLYIKLSRSVFSVSKEDASAYFAMSIESVSKFGDEIAERWAAVLAVAKQAGENSPTQQELAYRFIRCAEGIGISDNIDRSWNKNDVFPIAAKLDASQAFCGLSRWRDRGLGNFEEQLRSLIEEMVKMDLMSPSQAWCFSGFLSCSVSGTFASLCIEKEGNKAKQTALLSAAIAAFRLNGADQESWEILRKSSVVQSLADANQLCTLVEKSKPPLAEAGLHFRNYAVDRIENNKSQTELDDLFMSHDMLTSEGLIRLSQTFGDHINRDVFWAEVVKRVPGGIELDFLNLVLQIEEFDHYDFREFVREARKEWREKASIERYWMHYIEKIGGRFQETLSSRQTLDYWLQSCPLDAAEVSSLRRGIVKGLGDSASLLNASVFFSFIEIATESISKIEAQALLDFALKRFEKHFENDLGDGPWANWLKPPKLLNSITGLIWAALGSPDSAIRWQAAHCVRNLAENNFEEEVSSLLGWFDATSPQPYLGLNLPFYKLHAQMYLLIALNRVAQEQVHILLPFCKKFCEIALTGFPHILIQKFAASIALSIEDKNPGAISLEVRVALGKVGVSQIPPREIKRYGELFESPWHQRCGIDLGNKLYFGIDFGPYWIKYLGNVFGISEEQTTDLLQEVAIKDLGVPKEGFPDDPRRQQWNCARYYRNDGTHHSHGEYPRIDDLKFYYSYHSYHSVAARLLIEMPIVTHSDATYEEDKWKDWIKSHSLTREDSKWIADRRDPKPALKKSFDQKDLSEWEWEISAEDFFQCINNCMPNTASLCVWGNWSQTNGELIENYNVASALVSCESSKALARALRTCDDPSRYRLTNHSYMENQELSKLPFNLTEWIKGCGTAETGIDKYDPHTKEITYSAIDLVESIKKRLGLVCDSENRIWSLQGDNKPALVCEIWSEKPSRNFESPYDYGNRAIASVDLLKHLCVSENADLIIEVQIERKKHRSHYSYDEARSGYIPYSHKVFVFTSNGVLQDVAKNYQLG